MTTTGARRGLTITVLGRKTGRGLITNAGGATTGGITTAGRAGRITTAGWQATTDIIK